MERRIRLLHKRSHDKGITERRASSIDSPGTSLTSGGSGREKNSDKVNYIQIPLDTYTYLSNLEEQVDTLEDQISMMQDRVRDLTDDLYAADLEITAKDDALKQHEKVARDAVSGLEKANAEAVELKHQLESVTLLKVTAEDRASNLDAALKECMREIRTVKEENDQNLHELILNKTDQWDKIKVGLEAQIADLSQRLLKSDAENAALSRSLQEQSGMLIEISEQKSKAEVDNELSKGNIKSNENEISSLKYELHVVSKELDIRKEERNIGRKSAEAANKQHLEDVKKIAKLEAECQRLRNLVQKKLPGPAVVVQMKKEVGNTSRDSVEPRPRKPPIPAKNSKLLSPMEKEIKRLKEALATKNSELQGAMDMCGKMVGRFKNLEAQIRSLNKKRNSWGLIFEIPVDANPSEIMDDFLEMERLASSANKRDEGLSTSRVLNQRSNETAKEVSSDVEESAKVPLLNLLSKVSVILETQSNETDVTKALDDVVNAMQELGNSAPWHSLYSSAMESHSDDFSHKIQLNEHDVDAECITHQDLVAAVSRIHQFVLSVDRKVMQACGNGSDIELKDFSASVDSFLLDKVILVDFFLDLSSVLVQASELKFCQITKFQLREKEQLLVDLKSQLEASQMDIQVITENFDNILQEEKRKHQDALIRCRNLKEKLQRSKSCSICSSSHSADISNKSQEREVAATAAKLAVLYM